MMPAGGAILDIGCGIAEPIARYLIAAGFSLTGVDSSPAMIGLCKSRFPDHDWRVADMRTLALGRSFDGLISWDSFFFLTHDAQRAMFPIFRAHAAPNAIGTSPVAAKRFQIRWRARQFPSRLKAN